jgi:hypothetical protein
MEIQVLIGVMGTFTVIAIYFWLGRTKPASPAKDVE